MLNDNTLSREEKSEKRYFDKIANDYDENYHYSEPFTQFKIIKKAREMVSIVNPYFKNKSTKMLEVGCGTGEYTKIIGELFPKSKIVGLDISKETIKIARKKCDKLKNISFKIKSAYKTGYKNNYFDIVYGFYSLHHLNSENLKKEIHRILKPGGLAFFYEPNILNPVVYLIKSNKYLKKAVGDSPHEWGVNPLTIKSKFNIFRVLKIKTTEFIWPIKILSADWLKALDRISILFGYIPIIKYVGGSVCLLVQKKKYEVS